jgi:hypothetical protein
MPNGECPYCHQSPLDWQREWYSLMEQTQLYKGELASECPNPDCMTKVWLRAFPQEVDQDAPLLARSETAAAAWAQKQKPQYGNLGIYLLSNDRGAVASKNYVFREYRKS